MGIIGFGRIGQQTARIANAFGMSVLAYDTCKRSIPSLDFRYVGHCEGIQPNSELLFC